MTDPRGGVDSRGLSRQGAYRRASSSRAFTSGSTRFPPPAGSLPQPPARRRAPRPGQQPARPASNVLHGPGISDRAERTMASVRPAPPRARRRATRRRRRPRCPVRCRPWARWSGTAGGPDHHRRRGEESVVTPLLALSSRRPCVRFPERPRPWHGRSGPLPAVSRDQSTAADQHRVPRLQSLGIVPLVTLGLHQGAQPRPQAADVGRRRRPVR